VPGKDTSTLHSILYYPPEPGSREVRFDKRKLPSSHAIVIDESSMITPQVYSDLLAWVQRGVNILLVGDTFQLPPVITDKKEKEQWGEDFSIFSHVEGSNLTTVMRSVGGVLRAATRVRQEQRIWATRSRATGFGSRAAGSFRSPGGRTTSAYPKRSTATCVCSSSPSFWKR
jgi:ATP-dependent exoDNAse (exonuclease V) alpha subunit